MIGRRAFITLLGGAAAWPLAAWAEQGDPVRRIGVLMSGDENEATGNVVYTFLQALADLGWTERNVRIDLRGGPGDINRRRTLAQELVGLRPDIILASSTPATIALQRETRTIPIVFANVSDPVASGIVARLDRPSGNTTGFAIEPTLGAKWLELLSEIAPGLKRAAAMFNPDTARVSTYMPSFETAARSLKVVPIIAPVHSDAEIETAVNDLGSEPGGGLVVMPDMFTIYHRRPIISAAARNNVPAVYWLSDFVSEELSCATDHSGPTIGWMGPLPRCRSYSGGLLAYGPDLADNWRRAATYVDRILRGAKADDLPVMPTKYQLAINLKTAKALGLTVPDTLLARADEVIE